LFQSEPTKTNHSTLCLLRFLLFKAELTKQANHSTLCLPRFLLLQSRAARFPRPLRSITFTDAARHGPGLHRGHLELDLCAPDRRPVVSLRGLFEQERHVGFNPSMKAWCAVCDTLDGLVEVEQPTAYQQGVAGNRAGRDLDAVPLDVHLEPAGRPLPLEDQRTAT